MKQLAQLCAIFLLAAAMTACVQYPTEESQTSDLRPGISFIASTPGTARVIVDGQDMGLISNYPSGKVWLKLVTGTHRIQVIDGETTLLDESIYLGEAVNKSIRVN